jgi:hypothetical protein
MVDFTPEQEQLIDETIEHCLNNLTHQYTDEEIKETVKEMWQITFKKNPKVFICDSPIDCKNQSDQSGEENLIEFWSHWCLSYSSVYSFAMEIGVELDKEKANLFKNWAERCAFIIMNEDAIFVSRNPVDIHFEDGVLSNEDGYSVEFCDGWGIYSINGVNLSEQIVMNPETLTVQQINDEQNEEVRRIMIERYGSGKYLDEIGAKVIDGPVDNWIEGTKEYLFRTNKDEVYLLCVCPSTGKEFYLECPPDTATCQDAQSWLSGGLSARIISAS